MILKKPYAFLIKHFKLIHLILTFLLVFIIIRTSNIIIFFNDYVSNNYTATVYDGFVSNYVPFLLFFSTFIVLMILLALILLLNNKNKPSRQYELTFIYFLIYFVLLFVTHGILSSFEENVLAAETARIYRDTSMIVILPQIPLLIFTLIRGLGFNVKKFEFEKDLKDLEIAETDNEEFEISLSHDNYKFKRQIRRFFREFKYYIKENKFIFMCICMSLVLIIIFSIVTNLPSKYNHSYRQNDTFVYRGLQLNIVDSIVTNLDYKGDVIDDNYYVVLKVRIINSTSDKIDFKSDNFRLKIEDEYVYPTFDKRGNFIDYGINFYGKDIPKESDYIYALVYKIKESQIKKNYDIKINKGTTTNKEGVIDLVDYVHIDPLLINEVSTVKNSKVNEQISFNGSNMGDTKFEVGEYQVTSRYEYDYKYCYSTDNCTTYKDYVAVTYLKNNKTLLVFDYKFKLDESIPYSQYNKTLNTFIEKYLKVKYKDESGEYRYSKIINITPNNIKNKIVVEIDKQVEKSSEYYISFVIRNKEFLIRLK